MRPPNIVAIVVVVATATGCATRHVARGGDASFQNDSEMPDRLPSPDSSGDAQAYLTGSLAAMRAGQPQHAVVFLDAILRSDHLTDRGRANVYWLAAEAHRLSGPGHEAKLVDSLGGFLVAAQVLEPDADISQREVEARSSLVARKLRAHPLLGKSPDVAIPVEDARDPPAVVAELGCVEDDVSTIPDAHARRLERRAVICTDTGESLVLFFDVTATR